MEFSSKQTKVTFLFGIKVKLYSSDDVNVAANKHKHPPNLNSKHVDLRVKQDDSFD